MANEAVTMCLSHEIWWKVCSVGNSVKWKSVWYMNKVLDFSTVCCLCYILHWASKYNAFRKYKWSWSTVIMFSGPDYVFLNEVDIMSKASLRIELIIIICPFQKKKLITMVFLPKHWLFKQVKNKNHAMQQLGFAYEDFSLSWQ